MAQHFIEKLMPGFSDESIGNIAAHARGELDPRFLSEDELIAVSLFEKPDTVHPVGRVMLGHGIVENEVEFGGRVHLVGHVREDLHTPDGLWVQGRKVDATAEEIAA